MGQKKAPRREPVRLKAGIYAWLLLTDGCHGVMFAVVFGMQGASNKPSENPVHLLIIPPKKNGPNGCNMELQQ